MVGLGMLNFFLNNRNMRGCENYSKSYSYSYSIEKKLFFEIK